MRRTMTAAIAVVSLVLGLATALAGSAQARPTDGPNDPQFYGYAVPAAVTCGKHVCVHWVSSTADAAAPAVVGLTLRSWERSWKKLIKKLDYRRPFADGKLGGNKKFDVYLKELGSAGLTGVCFRETPKQRFLGVGYCLADNDFLNPQYGGLPPAGLIQTTAARSAYQASLMSYDAEEDQWFSESTSTWAEDQVFNRANLNRRWLPYSQIMQPTVPLDTWLPGSPYQYASWIFFEFLAKKYGKGIVRQAWQQAAADKGSPDKYSIKAVERALADHGGFVRNYAEFAAWNTAPARFYPEGGAWPRPTVQSVGLSKASRRYATQPFTLPHLTSTSVVVRPDHSLKARKWKLALRFKGPRAKTSPGAFLLVAKRKGVEKVYVKFTKRGKAKATIGFSARVVRSVTVTVVNASTRYSCFRNANYSCKGVPKDDASTFTWKAKVVKH
jgi:hypothetical protein